MGREFPYMLLQAVTPLEEELLLRDLHQLVEAELLYQRGVGATTVYQFKHALMQEAAYASLLRRTRQHYHQHIAQVLEAQFPDTVASQPELLAQHYTEAVSPSRLFHTGSGRVSRPAIAQRIRRPLATSPPGLSSSRPCQRRRRIRNRY